MGSLYGWRERTIVIVKLNNKTQTPENMLSKIYSFFPPGDHNIHKDILYYIQFIKIVGIYESESDSL